MERRRYQFQTIQPEFIVEDMRAHGVQLVGVSIGFGDDYGLYVVECVACAEATVLDAVEAAWGLVPSGREGADSASW